MTHSDTLLNAVEDCERMLPHGVANAALVMGGGDTPTELRALAALGNPIAPGAESEQPLLRTCNPNMEAMPLVLALMNLSRRSNAVCERCTGYDSRKLHPRTGDHRLTLVLGASAVLVHVCDTCRAELDASCNGLVWD